MGVDAETRNAFTDHCRRIRHCTHDFLIASEEAFQRIQRPAGRNGKDDLFSRKGARDFGKHFAEHLRLHSQHDDIRALAGFLIVGNGADSGIFFCTFEALLCLSRRRDVFRPARLLFKKASDDCRSHIPAANECNLHFPHPPSLPNPLLFAAAFCISVFRCFENSLPRDSAGRHDVCTDILALVRSEGTRA